VLCHCIGCARLHWRQADAKCLLTLTTVPDRPLNASSSAFRRRTVSPRHGVRAGPSCHSTSPSSLMESVCVLVCFVDPILGNRYGPGVSSFRHWPGVAGSSPSTLTKSLLYRSVPSSQMRLQIVRRAKVIFAVIFAANRSLERWKRDWFSPQQCKGSAWWTHSAKFSLSPAMSGVDNAGSK